MDLFHRKDVGWSMGKTLATADTIIPAWKMAVRSNNITKKLIFNSDRGLQYASYQFTDIFKEHNGPELQSISKEGNCWNNTVVAYFFKSLKVKWVYHQDFRLYHKIVSLVKVAEETNQTEYIFKKLNQQYAKEVQQKSKMLSTVMELFIIIVIGIFVGVILVSMYLPMFKLSSVLGG